MKNNRSFWVASIVAPLVAGALIATPAYAEKPESPGKGKGKQNQSQNDRGSGYSERDRAYFGDKQRVVVREYYAQEYRGGHCPPGLAKKNNGCMPPGQAKKWHKGRPLPKEVVYYDLPPRLVVELGVPPAGHKFVRVASDILLIAIGTGMVVDAIDDLGRL